MLYRLGLDIGTNSIGWAILELTLEDGQAEPCNIADMGVRIFPDGREPARKDKKTGLPQIGESLAVERRLARGMRRNRDRRLKRIRRFSDRLVRFGLIPEKTEKHGIKSGHIDCTIDPYKARSDAAQGEVDANILARALFHLCKRRGFLSNRKTDGSDKDVTQRKAEMQNLASILDDRGVTLGQYLHERIQQGMHVRFRGEEYDTSGEERIAIYPTRKMYEDEFFRIRRMQGDKHLKNEQWDELYKIFTFQRPLLPVKTGACTFEHGYDGRALHLRASRHLPVFHTFRITQEVNNLRFFDGDATRDLTQQERTVLYAALEKQKTVSFSKLRTLLKLPKSGQFNMESKERGRTKLQGNETNCDMRTLFEKHDSLWDDYPPSAQNDIVQAVLTANGLDDLIKCNEEHGWKINAPLLTALSEKHYPSSTGNLSRVCMEKLLPLMKEGKAYWEAAQEVYGDHTDYSHFATGEVLDQLPYYGEVLRGATSPVRETPSTPEEEKKYGKISNPTVHVVLNQLRKLVNALIARYGHPYQIHLEMARELKTSGDKYRELLKELGKNTEDNKRRTKLFSEVFPNQKPKGEDLVKLKLWEQLAEVDTDGGAHSMARTDVYTGKPISLLQLLSDAVEIEHILPFSRTYDNSMANKTVTFRDVNRRKGNNLPCDFARFDSCIDFEAMRERAQRLPRGKRWRFQDDAADIYEQIITKRMTKAELDEYEADNSGGFIDRQLVDTQYASRVAARYLVPVVGDPARVVPVKGQMTDFIRRKWKINTFKAKGEEAERQDHRHHAEDALIVAMVSRSLIKRIATETKLKQERTKDFSAKVAFPQRPAWAYDEEIRNVANTINVSFKPEHSREAKLYAETAYGIIPETDPLYKAGYQGVVRRPLISLKENEIALIRDDAVREAIVNFLYSSAVADIKKWEDKLEILAKTELQIGSAPQKARIRRVRIAIKNQSLTPIPSASYKGYTTDSVAFCDIWYSPKYNKKGKATGKWGYVGCFVSYADAKAFEHDENGLHEKLKPHPAAKKIMRLFKNDTVLLVDGQGNEELTRIAGYSTTQNKLDVRPAIQSSDNRNFKAIPVLMEQLLMKKTYVTVDGIIK